MSDVNFWLMVKNSSDTNIVFDDKLDEIPMCVVGRHVMDSLTISGS